MQLCVKQQYYYRYILNIDMVGTALCETAVQMWVRNEYRSGGAVCETAVQLSVRIVYIYGGDLCV
jgi:hypothetical protein